MSKRGLLSGVYIIKHLRPKRIKFTKEERMLNNLIKQRDVITKKIAIARLKKVIARLEQGSSLYDVLLELVATVRQIKEVS